MRIAELVLVPSRVPKLVACIAVVAGTLAAPSNEDAVVVLDAALKEAETALVICVTVVVEVVP